MNGRSSWTALALVLIGVGLALGGKAAGSLGGIVAAVISKEIPADVRSAHARVAAGLFAEAKEKLAGGVYTNPLEAHQHVLDGVQKRLQPAAPGWGPAMKAIGAELAKRVGENADVATVRKAFTEVQAGLESIP